MNGKLLRASIGGVVSVLAAALLASLVCFLADGAHAGWTCLAILGPVGLLSVLVLERFLATRARIGGIRRQLSLGGVIVVSQLLLATVLFVALMTSSAQDALFTIVLATYAGVVGTWGARAIAQGMLGEI